MRLFVAVTLSGEPVQALLSYQNALKPYAVSRANWSREENLHLTLAFIGEYPDPHTVIRALKEVRAKPFCMAFGGAGTFGSTAWVGLEEGTDAVRLSDAVRAALKRNGIPFDAKPMKPHITVARELALAPDAPTLRPARAETAVTGFSLMKSERVNGRVVYTELCRFELNAEQEA